MPIDQSFLDELTARCDIVDVVSRYVSLKRQGGNYFGLCPFHNEKSPSFSVAPDKQFFKCFGCGAGGGVISFVMKAEGLEFRDAVQHLADQVGMVVPEEQRDPRAHDRRTRMLALLKDCARFYYDTLWLPENASVQQYFARRGLTRKVMNRFGLGYAPDSFSATMDAMLKKGYTKVLSISLAFAGMAMVAFGLKENIILICFAGFLFFSMLPISNSCLDYLVRTNIDSKLQGRAWGVIGFLSQIGYVAAYVAGGVGADAIAKGLSVGAGRGCAYMIILSGVILIILAVILYKIKCIRMLEGENV